MPGRAKTMAKKLVALEQLAQVIVCEFEEVMPDMYYALESTNGDPVARLWQNCHDAASELWDAFEMLSNVYCRRAGLKEPEVREELGHKLPGYFASLPTKHAC